MIEEGEEKLAKELREDIFKYWPSMVVVVVPIVDRNNMRLLL